MVIHAFAEVQSQCFGIAANDPRMEPYYALAEELDVPIGIHMGPGPPGAPTILPRNTACAIQVFSC